MTVSNPNGGGMPEEKCIFPFKYKDNWRYGCVTEPNHPEPWCAVRRDSNGDGAYIQTKWGYCPSSCKTGEAVALSICYFAGL